MVIVWYEKKMMTPCFFANSELSIGFCAVPPGKAPPPIPFKALSVHQSVAIPSKSPCFFPFSRCLLLSRSSILSVAYISLSGCSPRARKQSYDKTVFLNP